MDIILGIDPGSRITGYGLIQSHAGQFSYVSSGCIRVSASDFGERLQQVFAGIAEVVQQFNPSSAGIEQVFMHQNPGAALKLGQARGAAIVAVSARDIPLCEYSARQVKQSVVGYGAATKEQVQHMVCSLLRLSATPQADAADALAVALCHAQTQTGLLGLSGVRAVRRGRLR